MPRYRDLLLDDATVVVIGGDARALAETRALLDAGARVVLHTSAPCDGLHDLVERGLVTTEAHERAALVVVTDGSALPTARGYGAVVLDLSEGAPSATGGRVTLVGGGPGDPGLLTVRGAAALAAADVVVADRLAPLAALSGLTCEIVDVAKIPRGPQTSQERINELLVERARAGQHVVRLKGGDSYVFGRGMEEVQACRAAGIAVEVVPGVTSAVAVPELAGIPVTHRGVVQGFTVVSGHAAPDDSRSSVDWDALARTGTTLVVLMGVETLPAIARALLAAGRPAGTPVACVTDGALPSQTLVRTTLADCADAVPEGIRAPAVTVVGEVAAL